MTERDQKILSIRPALDLENSASVAMEKFQNLTLRPILKFQNDILLTYINSSNFRLNPAVENMDQGRLKFQEFISKNLGVRNTLIGIIIGQFSLSEYEFYAANQKESNKRIMSMLVKRYVGNLYENV